MIRKAFSALTHINEPMQLISRLCCRDASPADTSMPRRSGRARPSIPGRHTGRALEPTVLHRLLSSSLCSRVPEAGQFMGQPTRARYGLAICTTDLICLAAHTAFRCRPFDKAFGIGNQSFPIEIVILLLQMQAGIACLVPGAVPVELAFRLLNIIEQMCDFFPARRKRRGGLRMWRTPNQKGADQKGGDSLCRHG
jgi:hypothetical protein